MSREFAQRNILIYKIYLAFLNPIFWGPIVVTCISKLGGMTLSEIYFCEAVVVLGFIFLEIPSGALADLIGRKKTVLAGVFLRFVSIFWFAIMDSPTDAWGANITWMIGASLHSGADQALFFDSLKVLGREHEFKLIERHAHSWFFALSAGGSLLAGFLAEVDLRLPIYLSVIGVGIACTAACFFKEQPRQGEYRKDAHIQIMMRSISHVRQVEAALWLIVFSTVVNMGSKIWFFTYNPYFELVELPLEYYGVLFFALNIVAFLSSRYAHVIERKIGERAVLIITFACIGVPIVVMGQVVHLFSVGFILFQNLVRGSVSAFFSEFLNRHAPSEIRATVLSINSAVMNLAGSVGLAVFGLLLGFLSLSSSLIILGTLVLIFGFYGIRWYDKLPD